MDIPFKQGLSAAQQAGITELAKKPQAEWNDNDRKNWAYATNNAPLPGGSSTPGQEQWVNDLYNKYFDRSATAAEMKNWATLDPRQLETFLSAEAKKYNYVSQFQKQQQDSGLQQGMALIDADTNLTPDMKNLAKQVLTSYKGGIEADSKEILKTFGELKKTIIDPHYRDLANQAEKTLQSSVAYQNQQRAVETEAEQANAQQNVQNAQQNLEASGLTFSGQAVKQLGAGSAYAPAQVPFGGVPEGTVNQANRLAATTSQQRYLENLRQLGSQAEQQLGTGAVTGLLPGYTPIGGVTGSLATEKKKEEAQTLGEVASNQQARVNLNTNTQPNISVT